MITTPSALVLLLLSCAGVHREATLLVDTGPAEAGDVVLAQATVEETEATELEDKLDRLTRRLATVHPDEVQAVVKRRCADVSVDDEEVTRACADLHMIQRTAALEEQQRTRVRVPRETPLEGSPALPPRDPSTDGDAGHSPPTDTTGTPPPTPSGAAEHPVVPEHTGSETCTPDATDPSPPSDPPKKE